MATSLIKPEDQEALPSYVQSIQSSENHPVASWESVKKFITEDPIVKNLTLLYRQRLQVSKSFADELKPKCPAITISAQMDGYGRKLTNFVKPTLKLMVEFDTVPGDQMEHIKQLIVKDEHTMVVHRSISGRGFHIFCKYSPSDNEDIAILDLFHLMLEKAQSYYEHLLGLECDKACADITRCAGLAYDLEAFFNWQSVPFSLDNGDLKKFYTQKAVEAKSIKRTAKRKAKREQQDGKQMAAITIEEAAPHIKELLKQWGYDFEPGRHNEYVCHFGKVCVRYGIDKDEAMKYADREFGTNYADTASVMKSCYKHTDLLGTWHFYRPGEAYSGKPRVKTIKQWLATHYEFQHNIVTGFFELRSRMVYSGKYLHFTRIDDNIENSLWAEMDEAGLHLSEKMLHCIINSDFCLPYDPLKEYLRSLPIWDRDKDPDYIDQLADRIHVVEKPGYEHTQELFRYYFKKWIVAMVVAWCSPKVVNQFILILVGKGGIFKTTFFAYLLPPELRQYFLNDSTASYTDKDFMEAFSSKAMICLDEFESVFGKNLSAFKSNLTKLTFSIRRPYDKYRSELLHRGALCGTSNSIQIITDEENRRYSPWFVDNIESPRETPIDYQHVYAQAVALGQEVTNRVKNQEEGWVYWLTTVDIDVMREHNGMFMVSNFMEDQILRFYKVPKSDTEPQFVKFRYSSEIMERIGGSPALSRNMSHQNLSAVMQRLGFKKVHRAKGNGWLVIEKNPGEINTEAICSPNECAETYLKPYRTVATDSQNGSDQQ